MAILPSNLLTDVTFLLINPRHEHIIFIIVLSGGPAWSRRTRTSVRARKTCHKG